MVKLLTLKILLSFDTDQHRIGRSLFIRAMGLIYLIAIASWWSQAIMLVGENGLAPSGKFLELADAQLSEVGRSSFLAVPNIFWWVGASNLSLHIACGIGTILAVLVVIGRFAGPSLIGLWIIYLSLLNTGGIFMSFQWDILLLEAGFMACFLTDWKWHSRWKNPPALNFVNRVTLVWSWLLIGKLMFFSGWVKLAWATPTFTEWWPEHTAMTYHYMTQPIPTWTAWWAHQLPEWFQKASIWPMYFIELVLPFFILLGRFGRLTAALGFIALMFLILLTGNYTYFNWLTIALCLPLVNDRHWPHWLREKLKLKKPRKREHLSRRSLIIQLSCTTPAFLLALLLNLQIVLNDLHQAPLPLLKKDFTPNWLDQIRASIASFHIASGYGLFRTMSTDRPEIIFEGSRDGLTWHAYDFLWKPDQLDERPRFVAPHQPRVAWQLWFAALEREFSYQSRNAGWIEGLLLKILNGDQGFHRLLRHNPFPNQPPKFIRARLFLYEFTSCEERNQTGDWWKRKASGMYIAPVSLPPSS